MDLPTVQFLCLEQLDSLLEEYTRDVLDMPCLLHYLDNSLCVFYHAGLSEQSKARLPANRPCEDFAVHVQWVLVNNGLKFTIGPEEDLTSPTPDPALITA